jgi:uncharacterized coiled-coil protein SlyX
MTTNEAIIELQMKIAHLERHIESQDAECYKLSQKLEKLNQMVREQNDKIKMLTESGSGAMPADEKPPHY